MTPSEPGAVKIRNRRSPLWFEMLAAILVILVFFGIGGGLFIGPQFHRIGMYCMVAGLLGMVPITLYGLFQLWDLTRPIPSRPVTARAVFDWLVLGIRRKELGPADGWTALVMFRGLLSKKYLVHHLKLGDEVEVDNPVVRYPAREVTQVRFAPDPKEDYAGSEKPILLCQAIVEMGSGRQFRLIVDEADARRLREWASAKGIAVSDCDGYRPRTEELPWRADPT
jgi:hypothetical protein